jgi:hypothetical protein
MDERKQVLSGCCRSCPKGGKPVHGSGKADYRLRYAIGLFDLGVKETALTAAETVEKAGNFKSFGGAGYRNRRPGVLQQTGDSLSFREGEGIFVLVWDQTVSCAQPAGEEGERTGVFQGITAGRQQFSIYPSGSSSWPTK